MSESIPASCCCMCFCSFSISTCTSLDTKKFFKIFSSCLSNPVNSTLWVTLFLLSSRSKSLEPGPIRWKQARLMSWNLM